MCVCADNALVWVRLAAADNERAVGPALQPLQHILASLADRVPWLRGVGVDTGLQVCRCEGVCVCVNELDNFLSL